MTASPRHAPSPSTKMADTGVAGNALAALFAAAAASSMQRQLSVQQNRNTKAMQMATAVKSAKHKPIFNGTPAKTNVTSKVSDNIAATNLISTLLNGTAKPSLTSPRLATSSSSPQTKTTATVTTTCAAKQPPTLSRPKVRTPSGKAANDLKTLLKPHAALSTETMPANVELRSLESWHDDDEEKLDDSCYHELVDSNNTNGWSADEMFKYNEKRHKILSSYNERTLTEYTTPLSKNKSKTTVRMASKLAKEIEDRVVAEGRITPESSDDDELFELERRQRKQLKKLDQFKNIESAINDSRTNQSLNQAFTNRSNNDFNGISSVRRSNKSSSHHSNSSATPATASLASSPTLNDPGNIKHVTSSSRNILRACLA